MERSKGGCITCRIRRVKCDETKPHCRKCQRGGRECDGYPAAGTAVIPRRRLVELMGGSSPPGRHMTVALSASPLEVTYFDLFRHVTAPAAAGCLITSDFWRREVLQLAQAEPAMWHATIAVGALQAAWLAELQGKEENYDSITEHAVRHYDKALALTKDLDDAEKTAAVSLVLTASTNALGRWSESQLHILASLRMMNPSFADIVTRMDFQAMTYSDSASPYPFDKTAELVDVDRLLQVGTAGSFASLHDASARFFTLFRAYIMLGHVFIRGDLAEGPFLTRADAFMRSLAVWEACMERLQASQEEDKVAADATLRLYHCFLRTLVHTGPFGRETRFDECLGHYEYLVRLSGILEGRARSTLSLELGLIVPLYTAAHRCRHPRLRRRALEMLRGLNCIEGNWRSDAASRVLDRVIAVEEAGLEPADRSGSDTSNEWLDGPPSRVPWRAWSRPGFLPPTSLDQCDIIVPEGNRVRDVCAMASLSERRISLRLLMCSPDEDEPCGPVVEDAALF